MRRLILTAVAAAAAVLPAAALAGPAAPEVPAGIAVPGGHKPYLVAHAEGVQIYECTASAAWRLVGPRATLTGENGKVIGSHYAGPRWETRDGSVVAGARDAGASVDPTAVDWLRLKATSTTDGRLASTSYIQRIHTAGGLAPAAADCGAGNTGEQRESPYSADYVFFKATGS
jgi:hypothetical protein